MKARFSQRHGFAPVKELIREDAPLIVRHYAYEFLSSTMRARCSDSSLTAADEALEFVCHILHLIPTWDYSARITTRKLLNNCAWYHIYEVFEAIYELKLAGPRGISTAKSYQEKLNTLFEHENIGWTMKNGLLEYRGDEAFESAIKTATKTLDLAGRTTASQEIQKAMEDLSKRPAADLTGAVHHAMGALECVAKDVCGETGKVTLGDIVKKHPNKFRPPLGDAISKLYGFASNNGRHITEGNEPRHEEVELIVGIAASVATYLSHSKDPPP